MRTQLALAGTREVRLEFIYTEYIGKALEHTMSAEQALAPSPQSNGAPLHRHVLTMGQQLVQKCVPLRCSAGCRARDDAIMTDELDGALSKRASDLCLPLQLPLVINSSSYCPSSPPQLWSDPSSTWRRLLMPPLKKGWLMAARSEPCAMPRPKNGCASRHGKGVGARDTHRVSSAEHGLVAANETNNGSSDEV